MLEQWLASILGYMEADPGYLDTLPQLPQVVLKNEASSRFWRGEAFSHALELLCGRSGRRGLTIPADDCVDGNPVRELLERSLQKLAEGYHLKSLIPLIN
ncbi:hypothetical protein [uncultured Bilophila sp.]|uniref:hypothetical protein n=1 Tax=uncultured Bilophila sp. TaxID=529385 RepID=UPI0025D11ED4|nr:hypothetical protein [uncultured Bilophila sp.]